MTATVSDLLAHQQGQADLHETAYGHALQLFWAGQSETALSAITDSLIESPDGEQQFCLYRLWIEILSQNEDWGSLVSLGEHLFTRGQAEPADHHIYAALRAIVHLELDEFDGARLMADTVIDFVENPYCMEVNARVCARRGEINTAHCLLQTTIPFSDFVTWQSLAQCLLMDGDDRGLNEVINFIDREFPSAMFASVFEFHRLIDAEDFGQAVQVAQRLHDRYPSRGDYAFDLGYALAKAGEFRQAAFAFGRALQFTGDQDVDTLKLLGVCHQALHEYDKARHYLERARDVAQTLGFPSTDVQASLDEIDEALLGDQLSPAAQMPRQTRMWLVKLSPRRYAEMVGCRRSDVERIVRPMGIDPRPGDFCFFAAESHNPEGHAGDRWRIVSIYAVDSDPVWHPIDGHQSVLALVDRPPVGIPVDVRTHDANNSLGTNHRQFTNGVYELEMGALDIITEAVRRHAEGEASKEAAILVKGA